MVIIVFILITIFRNWKMQVVFIKKDWAGRDQDGLQSKSRSF